MITDVPTDRHITYQLQFNRCTHCKACKAGGKGHGPYWKAYWRENGKLRSAYIGKARLQEQNLL